MSAGGRVTISSLGSRGRTTSVFAKAWGVFDKTMTLSTKSAGSKMALSSTKSTTSSTKSADEQKFHPQSQHSSSLGSGGRTAMYLPESGAKAMVSSLGSAGELMVSLLGSGGEVITYLPRSVETLMQVLAVTCFTGKS